VGADAAEFTVQRVQVGDGAAGGRRDAVGIESVYLLRR